jgi:Bacterial toxin 23
MNTGKSGTELRGSAMASYDDGKAGISLGTNIFRGLGGMKDFKQRTGIVNFKLGDFSGSYENDGTPFPKLGLSDGNDSYRTAAARVGIGDVSAGFNLFTGIRNKESYADETDRLGEKTPRKGDVNATVGNFGVKMPHGFVTEKGPQYRMGAAYVGVGETRIGVNNDRYVRHPIQDILAHHIFSPQPGFQTLNKTFTPYYQFNPSNLFKPVKTPRFTLYD